jgi:hypothetical protein
MLNIHVNGAREKNEGTSPAGHGSILKIENLNTGNLGNLKLKKRI